MDDDEKYFFTLKINSPRINFVLKICLDDIFVTTTAYRNDFLLNFGHCPGSRKFLQKDRIL